MYRIMVAFRRLRAADREAGAAAVEYAMTVAVAGVIIAVLMTILKSDPVREALTGVILRALP
ncbi:Flp pilus assembly pilin Flp [Actinoplanes octamycinicus]|uniref:Flp pilus assembly pilin Flp n=1 Tax=Actinoplanes octamycinicus TaxID=135948 RepID=A0A7W7GUE2_9ACTN|nr:DUF4244 domain-containing protein [Actinoplanes octamycinicus]MBB4738493.1 Flp pilus assembly pilin Flp [Actinoplanes octamycinicus]GIE57614.1 hypothetical protein Aoc01nite_30160 [Actinoplanes octamycinicus]